jgi:aminopeptidase N
LVYEYGSNERQHTWLDEGLNTFFEFRYEAEKYRSNSVFGDTLIPTEIRALPAKEFLSRLYGAMIEIPMNSPIETPAAKFASSQEYGLISYVKTALWLYLLESQVGTEKMDKAFKDYFAAWKNKHPQPKDLKASFEKSLGLDLTKYFELLNKQGQFK